MLPRRDSGLLGKKETRQLLAIQANSSKVSSSKSPINFQIPEAQSKRILSNFLFHFYV